MPRKRDSQTPDPATPLATVSAGSFDTEGAWKPYFTYASPTEHYVRLLIRSRAAASVSPAELAAQIRSSAYALAFPSAALGHWDTFRDWLDWPFAQTRTSAEEAVKRMGRGPEGHWRGGEWLKGPSPAIVAEVVGPSPEQVAALADLGFDFAPEVP